jgi:ABC-type multidrug transport system ATPase subunit
MLKLCKREPKEDFVEEIGADPKKVSDDVVLEEAANCRTEAYIKSKALVVRDLVKVFGDGKVAVNKIGFSLNRYSVLGLLGPNGAGKTTTMQMITSLLKPTSGHCFVDGEDVMQNADVAHSAIGYCPQHDIFWNELSIAEHLKTFVLLKGGLADGQTVEQRVQELMDFVELTPMKDRAAGKLSGGEKRRLSMAIAFSGQSKIVVLDEPTTGLDPEVRKFIWKLVAKSKEKSSIILSTHSMEEAEALSDQIVIMANGTVKTLGTVHDLKAKFGGDPILNFSCTAEQLERIKERLNELTNGKVEMYASTKISAKFYFKGNKSEFAQLFKGISDMKTKIGFSNWGITQPSLEQVFINLVSETSAEG